VIDLAIGLHCVRAVFKDGANVFFCPGFPLNKHAIIESIVAHLVRELEGYALSARSAHAEATHEQSKAENKYDTRALEASYLARGQSKQAMELEQSIQQYAALEVRPFAAGDPIDVGALVRLEADGSQRYYYLGPRAGGVEIVWEGTEITVVTPQSPIAQELIGKKVGDNFVFGPAKMRTTYWVREIW